MAYKKQEEFSKNDVEFSALARALSHPARLSILRILLSGEVHTCGDIVKVLPIAQPTVSQHLKELRLVGLIKYEIQPPRVLYSINRQRFQKLEKMWGKVFITGETAGFE